MLGKEEKDPECDYQIELQDVGDTDSDDAQIQLKNKYLQKDRGLSGPPLTLPPKSPLLQRFWLEQSYKQKM